jgi:hypothetical protein
LKEKQINNNGMLITLPVRAYDLTSVDVHRLLAGVSAVDLSFLSILYCTEKSALF